MVGKVTAALDSLGVRYAVGGSLASSLHSIPRATLDVDLVADLGAWHARPLARALESELYVDAEMIADAVAHHASFNVIYLPTMFKADVFVLKPDVWWETEMQRGRMETIGSGADGFLYLVQELLAGCDLSGLLRPSFASGGAIAPPLCGR